MKLPIISESTAAPRTKPSSPARPTTPSIGAQKQAILSEIEKEGLPCHRAVDVSPDRFGTGAA